MKKFILFLVLCAVIQLNCEAKDYTKLHLKEMKHAQKYETAGKYFDRPTVKKGDVDIKDPKIFKINNFEPVSKAAFSQKVAEDNLKYAKIQKAFSTRKTDNFNAQAYGDDFYRIYRIAERIIRANNLEYLNWRIVFNRDSDNVNAYSKDMNCIVINTALYDTFINNDDALALVVGHEMAHALLGHAQRKQQILDKINRIKNAEIGEDGIVSAFYTRKYLIESKNMEYSADTEGAILIAKAGYNLDSAVETISFINTLPQTRDYYSTHPNAKKRLESYSENRKYFLDDEWKEFGKYNIYKSDVLGVRTSSDRKSIIIGKGKTNLKDAYYRPETMGQIYARYGYKSYLLGEFKDADKYLRKALDEDGENYIVYLYLSYVNEALYKKTGRDSYLDKAKVCANTALKLNPQDIYSKKQVEDL